MKNKKLGFLLLCSLLFFASAIGQDSLSLSQTSHKRISFSIDIQFLGLNNQAQFYISKKWKINLGVGIGFVGLNATVGGKKIADPSSYNPGVRGLMTGFNLFGEIVIFKYFGQNIYNLTLT